MELHSGPHSGPYIVKYLLLLCVFLSGCIAESNLPDVQVVSDGGEQTVGFPLTLTDAHDRKVTFSTSPTRVISVAPKNTELVYALGLGGRLVGTTTFCNYPAAALDLPKIGGVTSQTIDQEKIVALNPDLILCSNLMHESLMFTWEELQIPVLVLGAESLEEMYREMEMVARLLNDREAATKVISSLQTRVNIVTDRVANIPADQRPKLFYQVWDEPLMGAGPSSFIGEILDLTGGTNILHDVEDPYPYVAHEIVVARNPDVIFAPTTHSQEVVLEKIAQQPGWEGITASRKKQLYLLDGDQVSRRGPRMVDALETMVGLMYPQQFAPNRKEVSPPKGETE
ncbi:ABC transporter substrate-binding protein [Planctomycetaceae bacterium]|nr:ABC transporter substrate-binding protein [Planctomycetaceae bacterium]